MRSDSLRHGSGWVGSWARAALLASGFATAAHAQFGELTRVVLPAGGETAEGLVGSIEPFSDDKARYQQAYRASELESLVGVPIREIAFRLDKGSASPPAGASYSAVRLTLATGALLVDALGTDMDENLGEDAQEVFEASFELPVLEDLAEPNGFDLRFQLSTPFVYSGGDLLLDLEIDTELPEVPWQLDAVSKIFDGVSRAYLGGDGDVVADTSGLVTEFVAYGLPGVSAVADCGGNQGALLHGDGEPYLGEILTVAMDDAQAFGAVGFLGFAVDVVPGYSGCGLGIAGAGELLLSPEPGKLIAFAGGVVGWDGNPVEFVFQIPPDPTLQGQGIYLQGLWLDAAGAKPGEPLRLTGALAYLMGEAP